jgi:beta-hydroxylase
MNLGFEQGFTKISKNDTFNKNDGKGIIFILNFFLIISLFILICVARKTRSILRILLTLFVVLLIANIYYYSRQHNKIHLLYAFSYIISSSVKTPEFLNLDKYFKNHLKFENDYPMIKNEVIRFIDTEGIKNVSLTRDSFGGENKYIGSDVRTDESGNETGWRLMTLKVGDEITGKCQKHLPCLSQLLKKHPEIVSCVLSILEPGVMIPIHIGYYKGIMRYMLPLVVPDDGENCFLWVNGLKYSWTEGKGVLWDDIYPHKVYNNTNQNRVLLYMDVIRPIDGFLGDLNLTVLKMIQNSDIVKEEIKRTEYKISIKK